MVVGLWSWSSNVDRGQMAGNLMLWFGGGLSPKGSCVGGLVPRVVVFGGGASWEVTGGINVVLVGPLRTHKNELF